MNVGAISWKFLLSAHPLSVEIVLASVAGNKIHVHILRSERWFCRLPDPDQFADESFSVSETRGILGGIAQPVIAAQSETVERAISDAVTTALGELIDVEESLTMLLLRGPALPKTIGRFLSLRPPVEMNIAWLAPIRRAPDGSPVTLNWYTNRSMAWDYESLLNSFTYPAIDAELAVEFIDLGGSESRASAISSILDSHRPQRSSFPRELALADTMLLPEGAPTYIASIDAPPAWLHAKLPVYVLQDEPTVSERRGPVVLRWNDDEQIYQKPGRATVVPITYMHTSEI